MPANDATRKRLIAGCMTGTSLDGLDAALAEITGTGLEMKARFVGMVSKPLGDLREELRHFASGGAAEPLRYLRAARRLGELHAEAVAELCEQHLPRGETLDFVVAHGQTIWHAPDDPEARAASCAGVSWQLFDPWPIVRRLKVPVCYDLRQADLIAGGQGAPITPLADWVVFREALGDGFIANLGGICNVTFLSSSHTEVTGRDHCPCNLLIDEVVRRLFPSFVFDRDGELASQGTPREKLIETLDALQTRFVVASGQKRSLGREQYNQAWTNEWVDQASTLFEPRDIVASAVEWVANEIAYLTRVESRKLSVVLAGGGAKNPVLVDRIRYLCRASKVLLSDEIGVPVEGREALEFAVLGALSQDGIPITLAQVTAATTPGRAGAWVYP